jgi:hypothetical protein
MEDKAAESPRTEENNRRSNLPYLLMGALVFLPLVHAAGLILSEYIRLGFITAGLAYLWWQHNTSERTAVYLLAFALIFALIQFDPVQTGLDKSAWGFSAHAFLWVYGVLVVGAVLVYCIHLNPRQIKLNLFDWMAVVIALVLVLLSTGSSLLAGKEVVWSAQVKIAIAALVWFLVTHSIPEKPEFFKRFKLGILGVFGLICLVGAVRVGAAFYYYQSGEQAQNKDDLDAALYHYGRGAGLSRDLDIAYIEEASTFRMAGILAQQGKIEESIEILSLEEDFVQVVKSEDWEGPEGGNLFYSTKCWKHLMFYKGEVEFQIYASGTSALGEWPLMRVQLGDEILGDVFVNSRELQPYSFSVEIREKGRQRLEISFLNDFYQAKPYLDRNLQVDRAEIQYHTILWR